MMNVILENGEFVKFDSGVVCRINNTTKMVKVNSFKDASIAITNYINKKLLGASTFSGGQIIENGKQIARVSYNGRVWDMKDNEIKL